MISSYLSSSFRLRFAASGQGLKVRQRRKDTVKIHCEVDLIAPCLLLVLEASERWPAVEGLVYTTICFLHADIFREVGVMSNHTSTRPRCFHRKTRMKQAAKAIQWKKEKILFMVPTLSICCATHTHTVNHRSYRAFRLVSTERYLALLYQRCACSSCGVYSLLYFGK